MKKKRVVIVDDSAVIRKLVARNLIDDGRFEIVGEAADPIQARDVIKRTNPDVLTLDVEMPRMNGLEFLKKLMQLRPMPVVMLSTETHRGSDAAIEALSIGAVDCIGKPRANCPDSLRDLAQRVFQTSSANLPSRTPTCGPPPNDFLWNGRLVLIGASTGGVDALERVLGGLPTNSPPVLIAQHMPASFLESFAGRLSTRISADVALARDGELMSQGKIRLAPGGEEHLELSGHGRDFRCRLRPGPKISGHRPSVDALFRSGVKEARNVVAVILTGMGKDGAEGMADLRAAGARTIGQNRDSCVVYGMPKVAADLGGVCRVESLDGVAAAILEETGKPSSSFVAR